MACGIKQEAGVNNAEHNPSTGNHLPRNGSPDGAFLEHFEADLHSGEVRKIG